MNQQGQRGSDTMRYEERQAAAHPQRIVPGNAAPVAIFSLHNEKEEKRNHRLPIRAGATGHIFFVPGQ